jgi:hypothetical protein
VRTGVDKPGLYDPKINGSYAELAAHYGTLVDSARALKPHDKPQVERPVPHVRDSSGGAGSPPRYPPCASPRWSGASMSLERDALAPLTTRSFVLATWSSARVGPDIHATVARTLYSGKPEFYKQFGVRLVCQPEPRIVRGEASLNPVGQGLCPRGDLNPHAR